MNGPAAAATHLKPAVRKAKTGASKDILDPAKLAQYCKEFNVLELPKMPATPSALRNSARIVFTELMKYMGRHGKGLLMAGVVAYVVGDDGSGESPTGCARMVC